MIVKTGQFTLSLIPPGSGKTFIIMLLAHYYSSTENSRILILTCSRFLEAQMDSELGPYMKNIDYSVIKPMAYLRSMMCYNNKKR